MPLDLVHRPHVERKPVCRYTVRICSKIDAYSFSLLRSTSFEERSIGGVPEDGCSEFSFVRWPSLALLAESID